MRERSISVSLPPFPTLYISVSAYILYTYTSVYSDTRTYTPWVPFLWRTLVLLLHSSRAWTGHPTDAWWDRASALLCSPAFPVPPRPRHTPELQLTTCPREGWDRVTGRQPTPRSRPPQPEGWLHAHHTGCTGPPPRGPREDLRAEQAPARLLRKLDASLTKSMCPGTPTYDTLPP